MNKHTPVTTAVAVVPFAAARGKPSIADTSVILFGTFPLDS